MEGATAVPATAMNVASAIDKCAEEIAATAWSKGVPKHYTHWATQSSDRAQMLVMDAYGQGMFAGSPDIVRQIEWARSQIKPSARPINERLREAALVSRALWQLLINPERDPAVRVTFPTEAAMFRKLADAIRGGSTAIDDNVATIGDAKLQSALETLDPDFRKALGIAQAAGKSVDGKMREICAIDPPKYLAWKSTQWCTLLGVSDAAIRKTRFWRIERKEAIRAYQIIAEENAIAMDD